MDPAAHEPPPTTCRLCAADVPAGATRCPACGLHRSTELPAATGWRLVAGLAAVYAFVAAVVVLTR